MAGKKEAILVFPSTHHMLLAEALLRDEGFRLRLVPAPPQAGELCTTAIAVPASDGGKAASLLEERAVLVKAVLFPEEAGMEAFGILPAELAADLPRTPGLEEIMRRVARKEGLGREDVVALLEMGGGAGLLCRAAEALAGALTGRQAVPAVVLDLSGGRGMGIEEKTPEGRGNGRDLGRLRELVAEMSSRGLVYLILSLGEREELPWSAEEFRGAMREGIVTVVHADRLPLRSGELVRDFRIRQILLRRDDLRRMNPGELADEVMFLRDNRPGPVGSGNLLPILSRDVKGEEETSKIRSALAALRLVMGGSFLPLPEPLWRRGELCGGNLLIMESVSEGIGKALAEAEYILATKGWSIRKAKGTA